MVANVNEVEWTEWRKPSQQGDPKRKVSLRWLDMMEAECTRIL